MAESQALRDFYGGVYLLLQKDSTESRVRKLLRSRGYDNPVAVRGTLFDDIKDLKPVERPGPRCRKRLEWESGMHMKDVTEDGRPAACFRRCLRKQVSGRSYAVPEQTLSGTPPHRTAMRARNGSAISIAHTDDQRHVNYRKPHPYAV